MLGGKGDTHELRAAAGDERDAIDRLLDAARRIVAEDGRKINQATFDRVAETLQAAGADERLAEARADLKGAKREATRLEAEVGRGRARVKKVR